MKIPLGLAALCLLSGPALAQEASSPTERLDQLIHQVQAVNESATSKQASVPLALVPKGPVESTSKESLPAAALPAVKPLPTATAPSKKQDLDTLTLVTDLGDLRRKAVLQKEAELAVEKATVAEEEKKKQELLDKIEKSKQILADNQAKQREIINNEIEKALAAEGQNLDSIVSILKDRVFTYSVKVYSVATPKVPSRLLTKGTVVTTLRQYGVFTQVDELSSDVVSSKDARKDQVGPNLSISAYPTLTDSAKLESTVSISGATWDAPLSSRQKNVTTIVAHKMSFVSKVTDLMSEAGDVHKIVSDKYEIVISTILD